MPVVVNSPVWRKTSRAESPAQALLLRLEWLFIFLFFCMFSLSDKARPLGIFQPVQTGEVGSRNRRSLPGCLQSGRAGPGSHRLRFLPLCKRMDGSGVWVCECVCICKCVCVLCTAVILFSIAEPSLGPSLALEDNNRRGIPVRVRTYVCVCFVQWHSLPCVWDAGRLRGRD